MPFLLGLFGLLTIVAGGLLSLHAGGAPWGIHGAILWTGGWLMLGTAIALERQVALVKLVRDIAGRMPEPAPPLRPEPILDEDATRRLEARRAGRANG